MKTVTLHPKLSRRAAEVIHDQAEPIEVYGDDEGDIRNITNWPLRIVLIIALGWSCLMGVVIIDDSEHNALYRRMQRSQQTRMRVRLCNPRPVSRVTRKAS